MKFCQDTNNNIGRHCDLLTTQTPPPLVHGGRRWKIVSAMTDGHYLVRARGTNRHVVVTVYQIGNCY